MSQEYNDIMVQPASSWQHILKEIGIEKQIAKGTILYHQEEKIDTFFYLVEGQIDIALFSEDGNKKIVGVHQPGTIFGLTSALDYIPQFTTAISRMASKVIEVRVATFTEILQKNPNLAIELVKLNGNTVRRLTSQLHVLSFYSVEKRICYLLLSLANDFGIRKGSGHIRIDYRITDQYLADIAGTSRVTVSKIINALRKTNYISKESGIITILSKKQLIDLMVSSESVTWGKGK